MSFRNNCYATVWSVKPYANYTDVRITTSRKGKDGEYTTDFSGFVRFIGDAHKMAAGLKEHDRIQLTEVACTNQYVKEKNTTYYNFQCFAFTPVESTYADTAKQKPKSEQRYNPNIPDDVTDEEMPF